MRSAVTTLKLLGDFNSPEEKRSDVLARRADQRRLVLRMIALSYALDALILFIYGLAGTTSMTVAPAYLASALLLSGSFSIIANRYFHERFQDDYLVQQMAIAFLLMLTFIYIAPEVSCVFLCSLFVAVAFGSLRSTLLQIIIAWTGITAGLAMLLLATDLPLRMPVTTPAERFVTLVMFVLTLGRCMIVGMFSSSLRESFYNQGVALREAYQRIEELAELDELTGAHNRRSIMHALDEEIERAQRTRTYCSVALIDLDWFKTINDRFGHPVGDEALRTFAITMFANMRASDKFGRYGGEEFLLILPDTQPDAAARLVDRLRLIVSEIDWDSIAYGVSVTLSAGITMVQRSDSADGLLTRADAALYRAKGMGRNRVETF